MPVDKRMRPHPQLGMTLIESLVGMLIFSIGLLALIGAYATSAAVSGDAQYRVEASLLAQDALQIIWNKVQRNASGEVSSVDLSAAGKFGFGDPGGDCDASTGAAPADPDLAAWSTRASALLPGGNDPGKQRQHVAIDVTGGSHNRVTVTVCWRTPTQNAGNVNRAQAVGFIN